MKYHNQHQTTSSITLLITEVPNLCSSFVLMLKWGLEIQLEALVLFWKLTKLIGTGARPTQHGRQWKIHLIQFFFRTSLCWIFQGPAVVDFNSQLKVFQREDWTCVTSVSVFGGVALFLKLGGITSGHLWYMAFVEIYVKIYITYTCLYDLIKYILV